MLVEVKKTGECLVASSNHDVILTTLPKGICGSDVNDSYVGREN